MDFWGWGYKYCFEYNKKCNVIRILLECGRGMCLDMKSCKSNHTWGRHAGTAGVDKNWRCSDDV